MKKFRELLQNEAFPLKYTHKFIGSNTPEFCEAVAVLLQKFSSAKKVSERQSGKNQAGEVQYLAITIEIVCKSADEVVELVNYTAKLPGLKIIL